MLTQTIPALVNALSGTLPAPALRALTQALGNCNQPLAHRGSLAFSPQTRAEAGPGYAGGGAWNPADYADILPDTSSATGFDVPGWSEGAPWNVTNYGGDTFNFPVNQAFQLNNYFGGPNVFNAGDMYTSTMHTENHTTNNIDARNINVQNINGQPIVGPAGPAGARGQDGQDGQVVFVGPGPLELSFTKVGPYFRRPGVGAAPRVDVNDALQVETDTVGIPTTVAFDPETCEASLGGIVNVTYVKSVRGRQRTVNVQGLVDGGPHFVVQGVR